MITGNALLELRKKRNGLGVSVAEISNATGIKECVINEFENGHIGPSDARFSPIVSAYAHYLDFNVEAIIRETQGIERVRTVDAIVWGGSFIKPATWLIAVSFVVSLIACRIVEKQEYRKRYTIELKNY